MMMYKMAGISDMALKILTYYKWTGIWQLGEEEEAKKYGKQPGDPKLLDLDNDGKITEKDKVWLGRTSTLSYVFEK